MRPDRTAPCLVLPPRTLCGGQVYERSTEHRFPGPHPLGFGSEARAAPVDGSSVRRRSLLLPIVGGTTRPTIPPSRESRLTTSSLADAFPDNPFGLGRSAHIR